jgi:hypothetical protein
MKSSMSTNVPKPKNQGSMGSSEATTQKVKVQTKSGPAKTGASTILYTVQPSGTSGVGTNAGRPMK